MSCQWLVALNRTAGVRQSIASVGALQCLQHVDKNAEQVELRRHPLLSRRWHRGPAAWQASMRACVTLMRAVQASIYLGSAPNVVIRHVTPARTPTQHNLIAAWQMASSPRRFVGH